MSCCQGWARWLIGIVSICVIICAVAAGVTIYRKEKDRDWSRLIKNNIPFSFILVAMICAVISSIIGFLLCCCKSRCLYITYLLIIVMAIIIEIAGICLAFTYKDKIIDGIEENWQDEKFTNTRVTIEESMKCCGFKTVDVHPIICGYKPGKNESIPLCFDQIKEEIDSNMKGLRISIIVMTVVEVVLLICATYLVSVSKKKITNALI